MEDRNSVVEMYFRAWGERDSSLLRGILHPDVDVVGPLGVIRGSDEYVQALGHISSITRKIDVIKRWNDGGDVLTWFDLYHTYGDEGSPVANWVHVENGLINRVRITFDAHAVFGKE
ncbi:nuclear transport factor 2 family protein [Corynebacterium oculi]|uniref:SnoaL-like domain protein n=1 Tax=Corynebacterium oculi TaxID=1544416 RepID=A0A0Q0YDI7_9CORY|nr:nuclear transport factor 2 family protein [Corynebacterium oculi]KQB84377.1 SnoaL-like domain protein [Corynebacterium oculi]